MTLTSNEKMVQGSVQDLDGRLVIGNSLYNGTTFEPYRGTYDLGTLITATAATTTQNSADLTNYNHRGVLIIWNTTAAGTGSATLSVQIKDSVSGAYLTITGFTLQTTNGTRAYAVYPTAITAVGSTESTNWVLPRTFRVVVTANNANPMTYTVGASLIL